MPRNFDFQVRLLFQDFGYTVKFGIRLWLQRRFVVVEEYVFEDYGCADLDFFQLHVDYQFLKVGSVSKVEIFAVEKVSVAAYA